MPNEITTAPSPASIGRLWGVIRGWFVRASPATPASPPLHLGADFAGSSEARPSYDVQLSMSAFAAFPWVYAACIRKAGDIAGLPLVVYQGRGAKRVRLDEHPLYRLLEQPSRRVTGRQFRAQQVVDLTLAGNALDYREGVRERARVLRLHPHRVSIVPDPYDGIGGYLYDGSGRRQVLDADHVDHVRLPSWSDDPRGLWGTGAIETLHDDLTTDRRAARSAAMLAKRGRPDIIVSPTDKATAQDWGSDTFRTQLKERLDKLLESGGTVVIGAGAKVDMPSWTPRDIEFPALRQLVREAVLAVTGVPPHMVGLPTATYAADRAQEESYWGRIMAVCADLEEACYTPWARMWGDDLYVGHDYSGVAILQESRSAALDRTIKWYSLGMLPAKAAAREGFADADFSAELGGGSADTAEEAPRPFLTPAEVASLLDVLQAVSAGTITADAAVAILAASLPLSEEEAQRIVDGALPLQTGTEAARGVLGLWLRGCLRSLSDERAARARSSLETFFARGLEVEQLAAPAAAPMVPLITRGATYDDHGRTGAIVVPRTEDDRAALWRGFAEDLHRPAERRLLAVTSVALKEQAERIADRLRATGRPLGQARSLEEDLLGELFSDEEDEAVRKALTAAIRDALSRSYGVGARQVGRSSLVFDPIRLDVATEELLAELVTNVNTTTKAAVRSIMRTGLNAGDSVGELAGRLMQAEAFGPARALAIARTEATRSVNSGALLAYEDAADDGIALVVQWLSARLNSTRPSHLALDGTSVKLGELFRIGTDTAAAPGGFSRAENVVNCVCTVVPVVES